MATRERDQAMMQVYTCIQRQGPGSLELLAARTGLHIGVVGSVAKEMIERGIISQAGIFPERPVTRR